MTGAKYAPGRMDESANRVRDQRRLEREKREANRPTGTEIAQVTRRLDEQQQQIRRATPTVDTVTGSAGATTLNGSWRDLVTLTAHRDTSYGKTRAMVIVSVSCSRSGNELALLECLVGGVPVASFVGVTLPNDSFGGTASTIIYGDEQVVVRGKSAAPIDSGIGETRVTVTVMSIA